MPSPADDAGDTAPDVAALLRRSHPAARAAPDDASRRRGSARPSRDVVSPCPEPDEREVEASLRPKPLDEFVGQPKVREQLQLVLESALRRNRPPDHVLLSGPPGLGKTSLAMIIAAELGAPIRVTSGPAIERAGDLAALLTSLTEGEVLFIDEIHRIARPAEELLYMAMEDFRVDVIVGKGPGATAIPLDLAPFTLVGATTRAGLLTGPLRDRFGFTGHMDFYDAGRARAGAGPLGRAARRRPAPGRRGRDRRPVARARRASPTGCCAGCATTPRCAPTASSPARSPTPPSPSTTSTSSASTGSTGRCSTPWSAAFGGGPVGVGTLAVAVGEEVETVEEVAEPFLVRAGLLARTPRGRVATPAAWAPPRTRTAGRNRRGPTLFGG